MIWKRSLAVKTCHNILAGDICLIEMDSNAQINHQPEGFHRDGESPEQSKKPERVDIIINPAAGRQLPMLAIFNQVFKANQVDWNVAVTKNPGDAFRFSREALNAGADVVAACGGDGTVMEVARGLAGSNVPLAIFPTGTANVMALELGIPLNLTQAVALAAEGNHLVRPIDMGQVGEAQFLLRVGVGAEAQITQGTPREAKTRWGNLAYVFTAISALSNPAVAVYEIWLDGLYVRVEGISCMIANSGNVGLQGVNIAPGIDVVDGLLDVVLVRRGDLPSLIAVATAAVFEAEQEPEPILRWQAREVIMKTHPPLPVQVDGEMMGETPIEVRILPRAVKIICPLPPAPANSNTSR
jgi:YegS/Rv2252/BmrU family lipid kinase